MQNSEGETNLSGAWIDAVHRHKRRKSIILNMDCSVSPIYGEQEEVLTRKLKIFINTKIGN